MKHPVFIFHNIYYAHYCVIVNTICCVLIRIRIKIMSFPVKKEIPLPALTLSVETMAHVDARPRVATAIDMTHRIPSWSVLR